MNLTSIAERVILLEGWRAALLAFATGAVSALAQAPYHAWPVLFVTMTLFVWLLDGAVAPSRARGLGRFWPSFKMGWLFGFGYFCAGLWWIGNAFLVDAEEFLWLLPFAVTILPAGIALFWGLAAALARLAWRDGWVRLVALAATLTFAEWLRGVVFTGFPWNTLGTAFMPTPLLMQSAAIVGTYGITFLGIFAAAAPAVFAPGQGQQPRGIRPVVLLATLILSTHAGFGLWVLSQAGSETVAGVKLRVVQPAIDQSKKWEPENEPVIMKSYLDLSNSNTGPDTASVAAFTHLVWPESAFPFVLTQRPDQLSAIANLLPDNTNLITGAMRLEPGVSGVSRRKIFNSMMVINGAGEIVAARDKSQLVPFGEFLPFQRTLEDLGFQQLTQQQGGFARGTSRKPVTMPGTPSFLSLICYEIVYPGTAIPKDTTRPQWLVNLTNDGWFGMTSGPYQHAHQTQIRAVEEGLPVVRAANTGISMVVDGYGRIRDSLPLGASGVVDAELPVARPPTVYATLGNLPVVVFVCIMFLILVALRHFNTKGL